MSRMALPRMAQESVCPEWPGLQESVCPEWPFNWLTYVSITQASNAFDINFDQLARLHSIGAN